MSAICTVMILVGMSVTHSLTDSAAEDTMLLTEEDTEDDDISVPGLSLWITKEVMAILGKQSKGNLLRSLPCKKNG